MADFKKGGFGGNRGGGGFRKGSFGGRPSFSGGRGGFGGNRNRNRDGRPSEKFPAVCAECGKDCQVPFRPSGDKPVYCSNCFGGRKVETQGRDNFAPRRDFAPKRDFSPAPFSQSNNEIKAELREITARLDMIVGMLGKKEEKMVAKKTATKKK